MLRFRNTGSGLHESDMGKDKTAFKRAAMLLFLAFPSLPALGPPLISSLFA
jgi:hypothetical protein